jgi:hypothetical protein
MCKGKGLIFEEVFAPVARLETIMLIIALVPQEQWEVHHMDVKFTFLNCKIVEEVLCWAMSLHMEVCWQPNLSL